MHIQKNTGDLFSSESWNTHYIVDQFSNFTTTKEIHLAEKSTVHYLAILDQESDITLSFLSTGEQATVYVYALLLGNRWTTIKAHIHTHLAHNHTTAHMHLISFLPTQATITLDGGVDIHPHINKVSWHLLEENIILGEWIQIKTLPMLDVQSNDVSASHGARIEKLDPKKLFYAQSRGLSASEAKWLLVHGYMQQCFWPFIKQDQQLEHLQETIFTDLMNR